VRLVELDLLLPVEQVMESRLDRLLELAALVEPQFAAAVGDLLAEEVHRVSEGANRRRAAVLVKRAEHPPLGGLELRFGGVEHALRALGPRTRVSVHALPSVLHVSGIFRRIRGCTV